MRNAFLKLIILSGVLFSFQTDNMIPFKDSRKLTWDDFQGPPAANSPFKAKTESNLSIEVSTKGQEVTIIMQTSFDTKKSWVKTKTDLLLMHERTHFDISELWSRKFKQRLKGKTFPAKSFQSTLNSLHADIQKEGRTMQALYDKETEHSINEKAQEKWTKKISADLKSLSEFVPATVTCKITK